MNTCCLDFPHPEPPIHSSLSLRQEHTKTSPQVPSRELQLWPTFIKHVSETVSNAVQTFCSGSLNPYKIPTSREYYHYPHFMDEESEADLPSVPFLLCGSWASHTQSSLLFHCVSALLSPTTSTAQSRCFLAPQLSLCQSLCLGTLSPPFWPSNSYFIFKTNQAVPLSGSPL